MKGITLWQPWAQFMALGFKTFETRGLRINYRGDICIHAGQHQPVISGPLRARMSQLGMNPDEKFPKGVILAVVNLYDCLPTEDVKKEAEEFGELLLGNYQPKRFGYLTRDLRRLPVPVPCKGKQAVHWELPEDVASNVEAQLSALRGAALMDQNDGIPMFGGIA